MSNQQENFIATGFGAYLAIPLIREKWSEDLDEGEARALLEVQRLIRHAIL